MKPTVSYLGPEGTYSHEALLAATGGTAHEPTPAATIYEAIAAVARGEAGFAFVPFENSIEGSVRATLDTLAFEFDGLTLAGEHDQAIRHALIARPGVEIEQLEAVVSHPQANAQCARFVRSELGGIETRAVASTAEAVRVVANSQAPIAALASTAAAEQFGCVVLREGVEDEPDNITRFIWVARNDEVASAATAPEARRPASTPPVAQPPAGPYKTSLVFSELGADHPGALVEALAVFSDRAVNLTRIESRPLRRGLGRYMFFIDLEGDAARDPASAAIAALREKAESVRILGSYRT